MHKNSSLPTITKWKPVHYIFCGNCVKCKDLHGKLIFADPHLDLWGLGPICTFDRELNEMSR